MISSMRICLLASVPFPPEEGLGYHVWNLARQLRNKGHEVEIITRGRAGSTVTETRDGIKLWKSPFVPIYPFHVHLHGIFVNHLLRRIECRLDLINAHTPLPPPVDTRLPVVTTVHSPMKADAAATRLTDLRCLALRLQSPVSQRIETALFRRSQRITAVASWVADALRAYGVEPASVDITGNGIEDRFLDVHPEGRDREPYILYVGRIEMGKGLEDLVEAAKILVHHTPQPDVRFVLVGKGPLLPSLQRTVNRFGLRQYFDFRGHIGATRRDELAHLYQKASIFVLPSYHEGMPTVLLEAMASGLPSISTSVGGAREVIIDGENGLFVPVGEPHYLADRILTLLKDDGLRRHLARNARDSVAARYSWRAVCERYLSSYREATEAFY